VKIYLVKVPTSKTKIVCIYILTRTYFGKYPNTGDWVGFEHTTFRLRSHCSTTLSIWWDHPI